MFWMWDPFSWLIFFFVIGIAVYLIIKYELVITSRGAQKKPGADTPESSRESALELLEKRLAKGEITEIEFERIKKKLEET